MEQKILVVDDEVHIRNSLSGILTNEGYTVALAADGKEALKMIGKTHYDCILCDIKMPVIDGMQVLEAARNSCPDVPFIVISGQGDIDTAVAAVKMGAYDYISKPPDLNRLLIAVRNAMDKSVLIAETQELKKRIRPIKPSMIGTSETLQNIRNTIAKVAPTDARVLITGPNGSGKELVAASIYEQSTRHKFPFVEVNCAAIPAELIESELFGHEKGAFTSAVKQRIGKFEQADGGTLFLDEIGDMSLSAQAKVLRALQEGKITRVGGDKEVRVNVRVIAATNKNLLHEIEEKNFRMDLYHRLNVIHIAVPSLNERHSDIPELVLHFLDEISRAHNKALKHITKPALQKLQHHNWTGNIRELHNAVERLFILSGPQIGLSDVEQYVV